ncbi:MAG TPA: O-antigen ligase family protein [Verrucomicrobiae bacterium]
MSLKSPPPSGPEAGRLVNGFVRLFGVFLGLALLKFGNAVIMERQITWPKDGYEWAIAQWPVAMGCGLLAILAISGAALARWRIGKHRWLVVLPLAWLGWQLLAATTTVDGVLTGLTLRHFAACVVCFYIGYFALGRATSLGGLWGLVIAAMLLVILVGVDQRFRGQAETQAFLLKNEQSHWRDLPPDQVTQMERDGLLFRTPEGWTVNPGLLKKAESRRISSTLFYPNSLAGAILLVLPPCLVTLATTRRLTPAARWFAGSAFGLGAMACLFWSGSKSGWLLALVLAVITLLRSPLNRQIKTGIVIAVLVFGMAGFAARYAGFFQRGATSVVARFDYWRAAWQTAASHPMLGTGPGTFSRAYQGIKKPESEMARLTHNDYLQQASDSGWPGFLLYCGLILGGLLISGKLLWASGSWEQYAVWLGTLGWALQGMVEFGLYIPALAWTAFTMLGWLVAGAANDSTLRRNATRLPTQT